MSDSRNTITRQDFLKKFVATGIKYEEAARIYQAMVDVFSDAVVTGQKVTIGQVMSIKPVRRKARAVNMGFRGVKQTLYLGNRISFKCSVFKDFLDKHQIDWNL